MEETGKKFNQPEYIARYVKEHYHNLKIRIPKEAKPIIDSISEETGKSINQLVIEAIEKTYNVVIK